MMSRKIVQVGNQNLRVKCQKVDTTTLQTYAFKRLITGMHRRLIKIGGVGLAAPQVGVQLQLFVVRIYPTKYRPLIEKVEPYTVINPVIRARSDTQEADYEGCFSVAEARLFAKVTRPTLIDVSYCNEDGQTVTKKLYGLEARVFLHEYDHLHGKVFLDSTVDLKSVMSASEYRASQETN